VYRDHFRKNVRGHMCGERLRGHKGETVWSEGLRGHHRRQGGYTPTSEPHEALRLIQQLA